MNHNGNLILIKHSLPEILENVPAREWELSVEGSVRAKKLADRLIQYQPSIVISSLELKAHQTAEIIGRYLKLKIHTVDSLHEHDRSSSPFYPDSEFQSLMQNFFEEPDKLIFGNETANQAFVRFRDSVQSILSSYNDEKIIVVSHGTVISLFVSRVTEYDGYFLWKNLGLPSFIVLDVKSKSLLTTENIN